MGKIENPREFISHSTGVPVSVTSGWRSPAKNKAVGGVPNSAHLRPDTAYDFVPEGISTAEAVKRFAASGQPFDQLIDEGNHVHLSLDPRYRGQVMNKGPQKMANAQSTAGISDDELLAAIAGEPLPSSKAVGAKSAAGISDEDLMRAIIGEHPAKDSGAASLATPAVSASKIAGKLPPRFGKKDAGVLSLGIPFVQDLMAGVATIEDAARNAWTGSGGLPIGENFRARSQELQDRKREFEAEHPRMRDYGWTLGLFAGGAGAGGGGGAGIKTLSQLIKSGATAGATTGAAYGLGTPSENDSAGNRLLQGGLGATVGAVTGGALPLVAKGVASTIGGAGKIAGAVGKRAGILPRNADREAEATLLRALERDAAAPSAINALVDSGKPLTIMDVAGSNTQRLGRKLVTQPGEAGERLASFLSERSADQSGRVMGDITKHLATNTDVYGLADKLVKQRSAASKPLYTAAFSRPPVATDRLKSFASDPDIQAGMKEGIALARRDALAKGERFDPNAYAVTGFDAGGDPKLGPVPTWRAWQAAKEGLDERINAYRDKTTGKLQMTKAVSSLIDLRNALLKELDAANPDYKKARQAWAGPSSAHEALERGDGFMRSDPEQIAQAMGRMSDAEKEFYRIGAARALQDRADKAADGADLSKRLFGNKTVRSQINAVFGPNASEKFAKAMGDESRMAATNRFVLGGSNTANKMADFSDPGATFAQEMLEGGLAGGPKGAIINPAMGAARRGVRSLLAMNPNSAATLADILTAQGEKAAPRLNALLAAQAKQVARKHTRQTLGDVLNRGAARAAGAGAARSGTR